MLLTPKLCRSYLQWHQVGVQVRYCLHVQQRLLKVEWPIRLAEHHMARTISVGDMEGGGSGGQILFNGLRVRMAISTGVPAFTLRDLSYLPLLVPVCCTNMQRVS